MRPFVESGQTFLTLSGRITNPAPRIDVSTNRKCLNSLGRLHEWLWKECVTETIDNDYLGTIVSQINPRRLSDSDLDVLHEVLFGNA